METAEAKELTVGKRLRWARKRAGKTLDALAEEIGTTRQAIIRWEQNTHQPNETSRERLGRALDLHPDFFKDENEAPTDEDDGALQRKARELVSPFPRADGRGPAGRVPKADRRDRAGG